MVIPLVNINIFLLTKKFNNKLKYNVTFLKHFHITKKKKKMT